MSPRCYRRSDALQQLPRYFCVSKFRKRFFKETVVILERRSSPQQACEEAIVNFYTEEQTRVQLADGCRNYRASYSTAVGQSYR
jgi:hypothetical protein